MTFGRACYVTQRRNRKREARASRSTGSSSQRSRRGSFSVTVIGFTSTLWRLPPMRRSQRERFKGARANTAASLLSCSRVLDAKRAGTNDAHLRLDGIAILTKRESNSAALEPRHTCADRRALGQHDGSIPVEGACTVDSGTRRGSGYSVSQRCRWELCELVLSARHCERCRTCSALVSTAQGGTLSR